MFHLRPCFIVVLLLTASCARETSKEPAYFDALRLVGAMREDELMLLAVRSAKAPKNDLDAQDAACLDRFDFTELTDIAARHISEQMTAAEVEDALGYFHSAGGRKLVRRAELELSGKLAGAGELSAPEQAELEQFKEHAAGRKLFQDGITKTAAAMEEATTRFDRHVEDCAYRRQSQREQAAPPESCKSKSAPSLDHVCLANYAAEGRGENRQASVEVECRHHGKALRSEIDLPDPKASIALRWSPSRELEILVQNDQIRITSSDDGNSALRFRFASRKPTDPAPLDCLPVAHDRPPLLGALPMAITVASWRTSRAPGLCTMTARVPKEEASGAGADVLMQFRRQKVAALPFATSSLAFIVQINQGMSERPLFVNSGAHPLSLVELPQQNHILAGKEAEALLESLTSEPGELTVKPEDAPGYTIQISRQDFDFAYADFSECLAELKAT